MTVKKIKRRKLLKLSNKKFISVKWDYYKCTQPQSDVRDESIESIQKLWSRADFG